MRSVRRAAGFVAGLACAASLAAAGPVAAAELEGVVAPPLPSAAATAQAGLVDLAQGDGPNVFGALKGLGRHAYFGAVALGGGEAPEAAFGGDGYTDPLIFTVEGVAREAQAEAVAVQPDGKVVVAGYLQEGIRRPTSFSPLLVRYGADGSLDPTFGAGGVVGARPQGHDRPQLRDVAIAADGTIFTVGGREESGSGFGPPSGILTAYRADGKLDTAFGDGGSVTITGKHHSYTTLRHLLVLPNGRILAVGYLNRRLLLVRLTPTGKLDRKFGGGDGEVTLDLHSDTCCETASLGVDGMGRIVIGAMGGDAAKWRVFLARYLPSGGIDRSFGKRGVESPLLPRRLGVMNGLAIQPDGRIVTVGRAAVTKVNGEGPVFAAFRYLPDGRPDRRFGRDGLATLKAGSESDAGAALTLDDGVLVGGSFDSGQGETGLLLGRAGAP